jgi:membrane dipeptidase
MCPSFPSLVQFVMERGGGTDEQMRMFAGDNLLRVWADVERWAGEIQATGEKTVERGV